MLFLSLFVKVENGARADVKSFSKQLTFRSVPLTMFLNVSEDLKYISWIAWTTCMVLILELDSLNAFCVPWKKEGSRMTFTITLCCILQLWYELRTVWMREKDYGLCWLHRGLLYKWTARALINMMLNVMTQRGAIRL